jgi:hypothetical protein
LIRHKKEKFIMGNEEALHNIDKEEQERVEEVEANVLLSAVTGGGVAKRAIGWAGINGSVGAVIANHKGWDVDKAVAVNAAVGAGVSLAADGVIKVIMKRP